MTDVDGQKDEYRKKFAHYTRKMLNRPGPPANKRPEDFPPQMDVPDFGGAYDPVFEKQLSEFLEVGLLREAVLRVYSDEWRTKWLLRITLFLAVVTAILAGLTAFHPHL
jgi:hypothetical protein